MDALPGLHPQRDAVATGLSMAGAGARPLLCRLLERANSVSAPAAATEAVVCGGRSTDLGPDGSPLRPPPSPRLLPTTGFAQQKGSRASPWGLTAAAGTGQDRPAANSSTLPLLSPAGGGLISSYKIVRYPAPPQPKCPQGREPLFRPSEQGTHKLGDDEGSPLLLFNKSHMVGMCVY